MLIFGTRGKTLQLPLDDTHRLLLLYRYFHLFWIGRLAYGTRYALATYTEAGWAAQDLTAEDARQMMGERPLPTPSAYDRFSLIGLIVALVLIAVIGNTFFGS